MAITISGENNNDRITAQDGVIDTISGFNIAGIITASSFTGDLTGDVTGNITGNVTGNINNSTLLLQTGGTERLRITSGGEVLIGTTTDANIKLDVEGSLRAKSAGYVAPASGTGLEIYYATNTLNDAPSGYLLSYDRSSSAYKKINYDASEHKFRTSGTERLTIDSNGRVGLGINNPGDYFSSYNRVVIGRTNDTGGMTIVSAPTSGGYIVFADGTSGSEAYRGMISYAHSNDSMRFSTDADSPTMVLDNGRRVGIGTVSPAHALDIQGSSGSFTKLALSNQTMNTSKYEIIFGDQGQVNHVVAANREITFATNNTERLRIDSSGRLLVGTTTVRTNLKNHNGNATTPKFQFETANVDNANDLSLIFGRNNSFASEIIFGKHRTATVNGNTIVQSGDRLGGITFSGSDGTNFIPAAYIQGSVGGTPGTNDMPGRLQFFTTADGASTPSERLSIQSNGNMALGSGATINGLRYFDVQNASSAANNHGSILRLITSNAAGNSTTSVDMVKYKDGNFYINNNETSGSTNFNTGGSTRLSISATGQVTKPYQYVFTVSTSGTSKSGGWTKITGLAPYTSQCTGVSDGTNWSNTNQQFTAPVSGVYYFFVGGWASPNNNGQRYAYSFKHQNGNNLIFIGGGDYCTQDSPMAGWSRTIKLNAGEWVELWGYSAITATWGNGSHHFYWGGYLLG